MASTKLKSSNGYRAEMDDAERASRDEIMALQTGRLARTLAHAYDNVTHYRNAFDKAGVHPGDFRQLSDLKNFPFTVKTDLRDNYPFNMFAVPREKLVRIHASSGTTGKPIVVGYTQADIDIWSEVMARSIRAVMRAEATGEQAIAIGVMHDHAGAAAGGADRARHHLRPHIDIGLGISD